MLDTARGIRERLLAALGETEMRGNRVVPKDHIAISRHEALVMVMLLEHVAMTNVILTTASEFLRASKKSTSRVSGWGIPEENE